MNQQISEEFDKKFTSVWNSKHSEFIRIPDGIKGNVKAFFDQQIQEARDRLSMRRKVRDIDWPDEYDLAHDRGIDEADEILKSML